MLSKKIVLVTGASGFIGSQVVDHLLKAGYAVRGMSRSAKAEALRKSYNTPDFQLVVVDDLVKGDMSAALEGVSGVIHLASPLPSPGVDIITIAVESTKNILRQAYEAGVYHFVMVSSSISALAKWPDDFFNSSITLTADDWNPTTVEEARKPETHPHVVYGVSKTLAERAAWEFFETHSQMDVTTLLPPFVYGPLSPSHVVSPACPKASLSSNSYIYDILCGPEGNPPQFGSPQCVDVRDVARAAVLALAAPPAPLGTRKRIHLLGGTFKWGEALRHLAAVRPHLKERLLYRGVPAWEDRPGALKADVHNAQKFLGISEFVGWKKSFEDAVDSLLEREAADAWVR